MNIDSSASVDLFIPASPGEIDLARGVIREYGASLAVDLAFQDFESELAQLPGEYAAPRGVLMLARVGDRIAGCCALRPLDTSDYVNACEMKRLFVRPAFRRLGLGRRLAEAMLDAARVNGYDHLLLDTLDDMEAARTLYEDLGFVEIPPFYHNPIPGAHYLMVPLSESRL